MVPRPSRQIDYLWRRPGGRLPAEDQGLPRGPGPGTAQARRAPRALLEPWNIKVEPSSSAGLDPASTFSFRSQWLKKVGPDQVQGDDSSRSSALQVVGKMVDAPGLEPGTR